MTENHLQTIPTTPYLDQNPGTAGLRKTVKHFQQAHYFENFFQSILSTLASDCSHLVIGIDGRYLSNEMLQKALKIAIGNQIPSIYTGLRGMMTTPMCAYLVSKQANAIGVMLTASHNPGGKAGDFGVKIFADSGRAASVKETEDIFSYSQNIREFISCQLPDITLTAATTHHIHHSQLNIIDAFYAYDQLMQSCFDYDVIRDGLKNNTADIVLDAMHGAAGEFALQIFNTSLGIPLEQLLNTSSKKDFGGRAPNPTPKTLKALIKNYAIPNKNSVFCATDGDGDRYCIASKKQFIQPSDSIAILAEHARLIPQFKSGLRGVARSLPTSRALDRVAKSLGIPCFETPTGWKHFGHLQELNLIDICGEESFGTSGSHVKEKDGLWAILFWLNILCQTKQQPDDVIIQHWKKFGRSFYCRHDYKRLTETQVNDIKHTLNKAINNQHQNQPYNEIKAFEYQVPNSLDIMAEQGIIINVDEHSRIVYRFSGTQSSLATLRIYLESYTTDASMYHLNAFKETLHLANLAAKTAELARVTHKLSADNVT